MFTPSEWVRSLGIGIKGGTILCSQASQLFDLPLALHPTTQTDSAPKSANTHVNMGLITTQVFSAVWARERWGKKSNAKKR